ncbi:MAG: hypothetical protein M3Q05_10730 [Bacteroidota bacterium]|nr:hypothetical protein [Bacteroidota bacterium]
MIFLSLPFLTVLILALAFIGLVVRQLAFSWLRVQVIFQQSHTLAQELQQINGKASRELQAIKFSLRELNVSSLKENQGSERW